MCHSNIEPRDIWNWECTVSFTWQWSVCRDHMSQYIVPSVLSLKCLCLWKKGLGLHGDKCFVNWVKCSGGWRVADVCNLSAISTMDTRYDFVNAHEVLIFVEWEYCSLLSRGRNRKAKSWARALQRTKPISVFALSESIICFHLVNDWLCSQSQPHWEEMFMVSHHPHVPSWCLFKKPKMSEELQLQEVVFTVQGVLTDMQLPPLEKIPKYVNEYTCVCS